MPTLQQYLCQTIWRKDSRMYQLLPRSVTDSSNYWASWLGTQGGKILSACDLINLTSIIGSVYVESFWKRLRFFFSSRRYNESIIIFIFVNITIFNLYFLSPWTHLTVYLSTLFYKFATFNVSVLECPCRREQSSKK